VPAVARKDIEHHRKNEGYPTLEEAKAAGLFHPNCRHAYGLYIDLDKEIEELERELDLTPEEEENYIEVEGLPEAAKIGLAKALTEALEHGLKTGTECLLHIDTRTGKSIYSKLGGHFDYFYNQVISGKMTEKQAWKEHSHRIVIDLAEKYGWEYRRLIPNEK
jgi:hypothetical protein